MRKNTELKQNNIQIIRECFYDFKVHTKNELSENTGLSLAATTNILQHLLEIKEIEYVGDASSTGGRKSKNYILNKEYKHILFLLLLKEKGKYVIESYASNIFGDVLDEYIKESEEAYKEDIEEVINHYSNDSLTDCIVMSIPGVCHEGHIDICDYENLVGLNLRNDLEAEHHKKIIIENDVNVGSIGLETYYPEVANMAFVYQPATDYVGCGMIINHQLHNGYSHFAGELRYLPYYTHEDQIKMLESNPKGLLLNQILTLCVVVNPEIVAYYSDVFDDDLEMQSDIEAKHLPKLIKISDYKSILRKGLFNIGINNIKRRG